MTYVEGATGRSWLPRGGNVTVAAIQGRQVTLALTLDLGPNDLASVSSQGTFLLSGRVVVEKLAGM